MQPDSFVFDLAGVLLKWDPEPLYRRLFDNNTERLEHFFSAVLDTEAQTAISRGESMDDVLDRLIGEHPEYAGAIIAWKERWQEMLLGEIGGTVAALGELQERGHRTFALGNWSREEFDWVAPEYPFLRAFDDVLLSGDCGVLKPDEQIYALAESHFKLDPVRTVFIDDRPENVQVALQRGWNGIVFENPRHLYLTLMEYNIL